MDLTDVPDDAYDGEESPPDLDTLESADSLRREGPIRERLLDVVVATRTPTKVSTVAERADCDTETAREYLEWFDEMGLVLRYDGRPVRYERNDAYFRWRRIDRLRAEYTDEEILAALDDTLERIDDYRARFDAEHPEEVSLVDVTRERDISTDAAWNALTEWETLERRATLLDDARRDHRHAGSKPGPVDA